MSAMQGSPWIRRGFVLAALTNIVGMAIFSRGLTSTALEELAPTLFSRPSLLLIMVWGLAYLALARRYERAPEIAAVFAVEKAIYVASWVMWLASPHPPLAAIYADDPLAALFFSGYGIVDGAFGAFFGYVFLRFRAPGRDPVVTLQA